jgi:hypothetical protein
MEIERKEAQLLRRRLYKRPQPMPMITPIVSTIQSLTSALRLNIGWMSSIAPPNALAPINTLSSPSRPVRARGKASAAKAIKCTSLSLPSGARGGASSGQSMATVRARPTMSVSGISKYLRMMCVLDVPCGENKCGRLHPRSPMLRGLHEVLEVRA